MKVRREEAAFQEALMVMNLLADAGNTMIYGLDPWVEKIPWRRKWLPTPVFSCRESH